MACIVTHTHIEIHLHVSVWNGLCIRKVRTLTVITVEIQQTICSCRIFYSLKFATFEQ